MLRIDTSFIIERKCNILYNRHGYSTLCIQLVLKCLQASVVKQKDVIKMNNIVIVLILETVFEFHKNLLQVLYCV